MGLQAPPFDELNFRYNYDVCDPAFYMFDPATAYEMTWFLRNDPALGGWGGQPVFMQQRPLDIESLASGSTSSNNNLKIAGGLNAVVFRCTGCVTTSTGSPRTSLNTDLVYYEQRTASRLIEVGSTPMSNTFGTGALPCNLPPQKWLGNVDRLITVINNTGSTATINLLYWYFSIETGR